MKKIKIWTKNEFGGSIVEFTLLAEYKRYSHLEHTTLLLAMGNGNMYLFENEDKTLIRLTQEEMYKTSIASN